jgi:sigma-E factor negative regulatory protein RseC
VLKSAVVMYMLPMVLFFAGYALGAAFGQGALVGCLSFLISIGLAVVYDRKIVRKQNNGYTITGFAGK